MIGATYTIWREFHLPTGFRSGGNEKDDSENERTVDGGKQTDLLVDPLKLFVSGFGYLLR